MSSTSPLMFVLTRRKFEFTHLDISEYVLLLGAVVILHEGLLATAVPEVQYQVSQQPAHQQQVLHTMVLNRINQANVKRPFQTIPQKYLCTEIDKRKIILSSEANSG